MPSASPRRIELQTLLLEAVASRAGLLLECEDPEKLRRELYPVRAAMMDPKVDQLQFRIINHVGANLAITKGAPRREKSAEELGL